MKTCTKCKIEKPKSEFSRHTRSKDGLQSACKECVSAINRKYREDNKASIAAKQKAWREANRDYEREKARAYYEANRAKVKRRVSEYRKENKELVSAGDAKYRSENRDKIAARKQAWVDLHRDYLAEYKKEWYKANRDVISAKLAEYRAANKEARVAYTKEWKKVNPEQAKSHAHKRRARTLAAEGHFTAEDILALFEKQNGCCVYCRNDISLKYHIDHILALVLGGTNWPSNLQLLCPSCNTSKGKKTHEEFIAYRVLLGLYVPPEFLLI